jgi:branched-subunit amino acid aminotransferase/4-amino-4-deoxychorismate lyase
MRPDASGGVLRWDATGPGWVPAPARPGPPAVADSWLIDDGRVRGLELHWARFAAGCRAVGSRGDQLAAARAAFEQVPVALARCLPRLACQEDERLAIGAGRWFPRLELHEDGELRLLVRPAPDREPGVVAWLHPGPDPRSHPRRKGPDLERQGALRAEAARHGAGEAVLADEAGRLLEGAWTSLLWWEGDVLCAVPGDAPILPGITRRLLLGLARERGAGVRFARPCAADLDGRETWLTSALHGIRAVSAWAVDGPRAGAADRADAWQRGLQALAVPVTAEWKGNSLAARRRGG